jgi:hypothetical protein
MPRRRASTILLDKIVDTIWERVLKDEKIHRHEVVPMMIEAGLLSKDHLEKINSPDEATRYFIKKTEEDPMFTQLNKRFQALKYYRFEPTDTDGNAIRLDFVNDGVWQERKVIGIPQKTLRQIEYRINIMEKQPDFMTDQKRDVMQKVTNATQVWKHNVESEVLVYLQTKQPDPKPIAQTTRPKAVRKSRPVVRKRA